MDQQITPTTSYKEVKIGKTIYRVTSFFSGEKELGKTLELPALPHPCAAMDSPLRYSYRDTPCGAITPHEVWNLDCREVK